MANINLNNLQNASPLTLNNSVVTGNETTQAILDVAQESVGNFWFDISIFIIFCYLIWLFYKKDGTFLFDMTRSIFIAAGWCIFLCTAILLSGWVNTVIPLMWFGTIFFITWIGVYKLKTKKDNFSKKNEELKTENLSLYREIERLKNDPGYVEDVARKELGVIGKDEVIIKIKKRESSPTKLEKNQKKEGSKKIE